ncbi:LysR substrate-binding domain-containing protein [Bdellovibrio sp. HCB209]|uniref:LysR substrate-binding domain-containing protein n=1 Tax=Bdellovibrio sp. HCB209 TaxID=3394354 RepID=UPI0039B4ABE5
MDFDKLKAFIVVAEELNFRKSAEILGMSQPPLTRLISSLEKELGSQLFERTTRSVKLTGAGVLLLKEAREIAAAISRIESEIRSASRIKSGVVRIGFSRTSFMARFPEVIEQFNERYPKIKFQYQEVSNKDLLRQLADGKFDLGFIEGVTAHPGLDSVEVLKENLGVLLPNSHPLAKKKEVTLQSLKDETIILHSRKEAEEFHDRIVHLMNGLTKKPKIYIKADDESCPILVATGKGVSLTIASNANFAPQRTKFVPIKNMFLPVRVFWRTEDQSSTVKTFLSFITESKSVLTKETHCLYLLPE